MDTVNAEELAFTLSGGLGEAETGGALVNVVPKTGGNTFSGNAFYSTAGSWSQGDNLDQELIDFGITNPNALIANWLLRLTYANRRWGFGLCFLYLRNVQGLGYNHKRVYRIYRGLRGGPQWLDRDRELISGIFWLNILEREGAEDDPKKAT